MLGARRCGQRALQGPDQWGCISSSKALAFGYNGKPVYILSREKFDLFMVLKHCFH